MSTKRNSDSIGLASYLSPNDIRNAVRLTKKIQSAKRVEDVLRYQKQLTFLMAKAEKNKKHREKMIRHQALELKKLNKEQIRERIQERYFQRSIKPIDIRMVDEESNDGMMLVEVKALQTPHGTIYQPYTAVENKPEKKKIPRHYKLKSHS